MDKERRHNIGILFFVGLESHPLSHDRSLELSRLGGERMEEMALM